MKSLFTPLLLLALLGCQSPQKEQLVDYIDPYIGTGGHGHTFPGPAYPFGQIQLSPDNGRNGWDWVSGYHYSDSTLAGFSHTHLSGTGIGDLADLSILPLTQTVEPQNLFPPKGDWQQFKYLEKYSHQEETAELGYYQVKLLKSLINVELTTSKRVGYHRYNFPQGKPQQVLFNLDYAVNWDKMYEAEIEQIDNFTVTGKRHSNGWAKDQKLYFAASFSKPIIEARFFDAKAQPQKRLGIKGLFRFEPTAEPLLVRVAISSVSEENAIKNLRAEGDKNFSQAQQEVRAAWEKELQKFRITTPNRALKTTFYTALYHAFLAPYTFSDVDGKYKGYQNQIAQTQDFDKMTVLSLWDTFRSLKPLLALTQPKVHRNILHSMLSQYEQTGLLPVWELMGNETNCMIGYHAIPVLADAIVKERDYFDKELAYKAMKAYAMTDIRGLDHYRTLGYIPSDLENESVSKVLEYCYDDWCIAQAAKKLGKTKDYQYFMQRAKQYKNVFDSQIGFFRGKLRNGHWAEPFDPRHSKHRDDYFTEANGWQMLWFVPHDVPGLVTLLGGTDAFETKLDSLFEQSSEMLGEASPDISGMIGQYAHGNEPSHSTAFLYSRIGKPAKTNQRVHQILTQLYSTNPDGLSGNEDCGQMSAWYVFASLGLYPANPVDNHYYLTVPLFEQAKLQLFNDKELHITVERTSKNLPNGFEASFNGTVLTQPYLTYQQLIQGGKLHFTAPTK